MYRVVRALCPNLCKGVGHTAKGHAHRYRKKKKGGQKKTKLKKRGHRFSHCARFFFMNPFPTHTLSHSRQWSTSFPHTQTTVVTFVVLAGMQHPIRPDSSHSSPDAAPRYHAHPGYCTTVFSAGISG